MSSQGTPSPEEPSRKGLRVRWAMMGLGWRFTLYLGAALLVLLIAFTVLGLQAVNTARSQAFSQQVHLTRTMAGGLDQQFDNISSHVNVHFPSAPSPASAAQALAYLHEHLVHFENLGYFQVRGVRLVDAQGELLAAAPQNTPGNRETLPPQGVLQQVVSEGRALVTPSRLVMEEGEVPFVALVIPLRPFFTSDEGIILVVDTVGLGTVKYLSTPESSEDEGRYGIELVATDGFVVATSAGDAALGIMTDHYTLIRGFLERGEAGAAVHHEAGGDRLSDHIVAVAPLGNAPFFLIAEEPLGLLLDWPQQLRRQAIVLGGIAVIIVLGLGWIVEQLMVRPVVALGRATARIKRGDLETPVRIRSQGELARLAEEVESMRQQLHETVSSLDHLNDSLADQVRERTQQLRTVVARLMQAQEEERRRVARDLHDETAQGLTALGVILDAVALDVREDRDRALKGLGGVREEVRRLVAETRRLAYALRPSVLDDAGLVPALRWCAEAYLEPKGVQVTLDTPRPEMRFPEPVEVALFRVGQEAMSNIARHAQASHAWLSLESEGGWVTLTVRDDGVGFDASHMAGEDGPPQGRGLGLAGMKERVDLLGGRLHVSSLPGEGTTVTAYVPTGRWEEEKE